MNLFRKKLDRASIAKKRGESESALRRLAYLPTEEALSSLSTLYSGLTDEQAQERLEEFGPNIIVSGKQSSVFSRLAEAFVVEKALVDRLVHRVHGAGLAAQIEPGGAVEPAFQALRLLNEFLFGQGWRPLSAY